MQDRKAANLWSKLYRSCLLGYAPQSTNRVCAKEVFSARHQPLIKLFCGLSNYKTIDDIKIFFPVDRVKKMENKRYDYMELLQSKTTVSDTGSCWSLERHLFFYYR